MFKRRYQRLIGIITSTAILFTALAPSMSHAFPAKNRTQALWQEVCSVKSSKLTVASFGIKDSSQQPPQKTRTCALDTALTALPTEVQRWLSFIEQLSLNYKCKVY